jgi:metallo-beta-lactamase family protein
MVQRSIQFCGAAQTVTGSCHLIEFNGKRILVDCGIFQGNRHLRDENYEPFPFDPTEIDMVVVTHAHQDHIGRLPKLVKEGYQGDFLATKATIGIARIALPDAGRIQEEDARRARKHGSRHSDPQPLFTEADAFETLKHFRPVPYHTNHSLPGGANLRYLPAGHILGSAYAEITFPDGERILMGGDLGRFDTPIIKDPAYVDSTEFLVVESTYGDRLHEKEDPQEKIGEIISQTAESGGVVLIPSFAIGRTQELLYYIARLQLDNRLPRIPIFIDSPMAMSICDVYTRNPDEFDEEAKAAEDLHQSLTEPQGVQYVRDKEMSKEINKQPGPFVVIAGSGMCNGGRIQHHLLHRLSDARNTVLFTGYQADGTLGRRILDHEPVVSIFGEEVRVAARIERANALSAHADQGEILDWLRHFKTPPKTTFIVHGEPKAQLALQARIRAELGWNTVIPAQAERFDLA